MRWEADLVFEDGGLLVADVETWIDQDIIYSIFSTGSTGIQMCTHSCSSTMRSVVQHLMVLMHAPTSPIIIDQDHGGGCRFRSEGYIPEDDRV